MSALGRPFQSMPIAKLPVTDEHDHDLRAALPYVRSAPLGFLKDLRLPDLAKRLAGAQARNPEEAQMGLRRLETYKHVRTALEREAGLESYARKPTGNVLMRLATQIKSFAVPRPAARPSPSEEVGKCLMHSFVNILILILRRRILPRQFGEMHLKHAAVGRDSVSYKHYCILHDISSLWLFMKVSACDTAVIVRCKAVQAFKIFTDSTWFPANISNKWML